MRDEQTPRRATAIAGPPADGPLLSSALRSLMDATGAHSGAMYLLADGEPVLEMAVMAGLPRAFAAPWERVGLNTPVPVAVAARERRLVWVDGEEEMAHSYPRIAVVLPYPFALAALPVATEDRLYGAVFVTWPGTRPLELSERERRELVEGCDRLARLLEAAAAENRSPRAGTDLPGRVPVSGAADSLGTMEAARMVARLPYGMCSLDVHGRIGFANEAAGELLGVPADRLPGTRLWASVPWLDDPVYEERYQAALVSQRPTSFVALRPPADWLSFRLYPDTTGLTVRIARAPSVAGPGRWPVGPAATEQHPLVTIAQALNIAGALTETVGVQDVVRLVADQIAPAVGSRALALLAARAGRLHVLGHHGYPDPRALERCDGTPLSTRSPGAQALTSGVPAFFDSWEQLERLYPERHAASDGFAAWAYLPLIASGRPVGACVLAYAEPHVFSTHERAVLSSLAGLVAQALDRALLYDAKHRLAHGLQQALLPHSLPEVPGFEATARYLPATRGMDIGGDFYDLVATPPPAAVIGDVQGHNVTAAGLMGQVRTAVRAYTAVGQEPGEVMRSTNRLLVDLGSDLFASCLYLRLLPRRGRALMARAGHPPPLLRDADGRVRVLDLPGGPLLGIDGTASYPTTEVGLMPGSLLVLYTDGLVERPGTDIEEAVAVLARRLAVSGDRPLEEVADRLVGHHAVAEERLDDVALLLLRARADGTE
ncbi:MULTISPECIES: SpoIIE family protein phosphatase [unclassified Streptomyces]|uniref:SpoIIE family protein phosphatase n=1 Tax=unclassified Streptomyces TaxID=2593676 RepID=UPI003D72EFE4